MADRIPDRISETRTEASKANGKRPKNGVRIGRTQYPVGGQHYRPPAYDLLDPERKAVVDAYLTGKYDTWAEVCKGAGVRSPRRVRQLQTDRQILNLLRGYLRAEVMREGPLIAWKTLKEVMQDETAPQAARIKAAEVSLKWSGEMAAAQLDAERDPTDKPMSEWTVEELEAYIEKHGKNGPADNMINVTPETADKT